MWRKINLGWVLGEDALPLLRVGLEAFDVAQRARLELAGAPSTTVTPTDGGIARAHPAVKVMLDAQREYRAAMRALNLDPGTA